MAVFIWDQTNKESIQCFSPATVNVSNIHLVCSWSVIFDNFVFICYYLEYSYRVFYLKMNWRAFDLPQSEFRALHFLCYRVEGKCICTVSFMNIINSFSEWAKAEHTWLVGSAPAPFKNLVIIRGYFKMQTVSGS